MDAFVALAAGTAALACLYLLGARLFAKPAGGVVAVAFFVLTPLLWRQAAVAPAALYPLPFVLGWLLAVDSFWSARPQWAAAAAGVLLGLGVYSSHAAAVMMPLYVLLTLAIVARVRPVSTSVLAVFVGAFAVMASPLAWSLVREPERFRQAVTAAHLYDGTRFTVLQGVHEMVSWVGLTARSEVYYDYFNPAFLFLQTPVLLLPLVVTLPAGLYRIVANERTPGAWLILAGFLAAPFAAALPAEAPVPARILFITPFAAVVSTYAVDFLMALRRR